MHDFFRTRYGRYLLQKLGMDAKLPSCKLADSLDFLSTFMLILLIEWKLCEFWLENHVSLSSCQFETEIACHSAVGVDFARGIKTMTQKGNESSDPAIRFRLTYGCSLSMSIDIRLQLIDFAFKIISSNRCSSNDVEYIARQLRRIQLNWSPASQKYNREAQNLVFYECV